MINFYCNILILDDILQWLINKEKKNVKAVGITYLSTITKNNGPWDYILMFYDKYFKTSIWRHKLNFFSIYSVNDIDATGFRIKVFTNCYFMHIYSSQFDYNYMRIGCFITIIYKKY